jgi:hypothetical protein
VAFSCQTRSFCPSFAAKRSVMFAAFLEEEVLAEVGHWMLTFTIPKMLRPYFLHHRKLLGELCKAAWQTFLELMVEAVGEDGFRPAMVASVHSAGDFLRWNPHVHALAVRGGWMADGEWRPVPYLDLDAAEKLFRHKVLSFLKREGLISQERIELLLSWRHNSGFSVDSSVRFEPEDTTSADRVARYIVRPPVSLERLSLDGGPDGIVEYRAKGGGPSDIKRFDPLDFVARLLMHAPEPRLHTVRYYGAYSSRSRASQKLVQVDGKNTEGELSTAERRRMRRAWARLIRRVYEVDPLLCECGAEMKIISFITEYRVVIRILNHVRNRLDSRGRAPPG